jgi:adenosylmethionine-8-amino-7-oxononanoate aminotransferase
VRLLEDLRPLAAIFVRTGWKHKTMVIEHHDTFAAVVLEPMQQAQGAS